MPEGRSWILGVQIGASLLIVPLLYRALGEPGDGWSGNVPRRIGFAVLGAVIFFLLSARWAPEPKAPGIGRAFEAYYLGSVAHRARHAGMLTYMPSDAGSLDDLRRAADLAPESVAFRRHYGIALADLGQHAKGLKQLDRATALLAERAPQRAAEERQAWSTFYGERRPTAEMIREAHQRLDRYGMGWLGRVAALAAYRRLPAGPPAALRERVAQEARQYFVRLIVGATIPLLIIPQLGLVALITGLVFIATGVLHRVQTQFQASGAVLWESFILMLALSAAPSFLRLRPAPETQPGVFAAMLLVGDVLQLFAVGYLWWRLRRRGLSLEEIGLSKRALGGHVLVGIGSACVLMPVAYIVGILTQFASDRFFPNIAPPYHPLQGLTATSGSWEVRAALFIAAVIGAPLLEEIFFRGGLYGALRRRFGVAAGIVLSSAFFAILHPQLPLGFIPIAVLGAGFAILYEWRQSLVPGMVAHAVNNGVAFTLMNLVFPPGG
jgi:uncharacterized protein